MKKPLFWVVTLLLCIGFGRQVYGQSAASYRKSILRYTNQFRASHGLAPVQSASVPQDLAQKHSSDMARRRVGFGHSGFQNRTDRLRRAYGRGIATGENVAYGNISAKEVVDIWINSRPHRKNLLGNFNKVGIGIAEDSQGILYFTQLFVRTD
ncbi:MAG TPA: CAP domain-containing protein [Arachidicoccus sp.]|nr:CAP domain-containing protein [Arachidicoccus sp.]